MSAWFPPEEERGVLSSLYGEYLGVLLAPPPREYLFDPRVVSGGTMATRGVLRGTRGGMGEGVDSATTREYKTFGVCVMTVTVVVSAPSSVVSSLSLPDEGEDEGSEGIAFILFCKKKTRPSFFI